MPEPTSRTRINRLPKRGHHDDATIHAILDAAFLCHVGFSVDGQPYVIPTLFGRDGDNIFFHGSAASRMLRHAATSVPVCLEVSIVDAIVLARSAFHHSMNYRSVVVLGAAELVTDDAQKLRALEIISEHVVPGRWTDVRQPTTQELKATSVLRLPVTEASAKIRTDDDDDYSLPIWAGILPLAMNAGEMEPDPRLIADFPHGPPPTPGYLLRLK
jgi:nitroimidazol reductase NimA-like FMN-containing flavoprotein (pyridoxamine 5'-phosphate oxidase superfamily)